ncbi:MAG: histone-like protein [Candidatus Hadarchaeaceae archaeon]
MVELAIAPFKRMLRKVAPNMKISDPAKREIRNMAERFAMDVLRGAIDIAKISRRRTVMVGDIRAAKRQLVKTI